MAYKYKGHELTSREADRLENKLYYDFAYGREVGIDDFHFMSDRGYAHESLIRRATLPGMTPEIRWPYKLPM